jgi:hypothetical protein
MSPTPHILVTLTILALAAPSDASAQTRRHQFQIGINAGLQAASESFTDRLEFERFTETATADMDHGVDPGPMFDGSVGITFRNAFGAAVAVSRFTRDGSAHIDARIPHPVFDNRPRAISGEQSGVTRAETSVHAQATYTIDPRGPLRVVFSGGPSFVNTEQELISGVRYAESYPFDEATFVTADTRRSKASGIGFNVGADVTWMIGRSVGIGGLLRFTRVSVELESESRAIPLRAGGLMAGAGLRMVF